MGTRSLASTLRADTEGAGWVVQQVCEGHPRSTAEGQFQESLIREETYHARWFVGEEGLDFLTLFLYW